jgi:hypothetical protein
MWYQRFRGTFCHLKDSEDGGSKVLRNFDIYQITYCDGSENRNTNTVFRENLKSDKQNFISINST